MDNHNHQPVQAIGPKLIFALIITTLVFLLEIVGGYWTNSLALLSDAWHVLTDAAALGLAWLAFQQAKKKPSLANTFGFQRFEVITAFLNGLSLLLISIYIMYEAIQRFMAPEAIKSKEMFIIALIGLVANGLIAVLLNSSAKDSINVRSAFLHVIGDALASLGVIAGGLVMLKYQWYLVDPIISMLISLLIIKGAWRVTKEAFHILMEGTPDSMNLPEIITALQEIEGVAEIHDVHAWRISGKYDVLSLHVQISNADNEQILQTIKELLREDFGIKHATVQVERTCQQEGHLLSLSLTT